MSTPDLWGLKTPCEICSDIKLMLVHAMTDPEWIESRPRLPLSIASGHDLDVWGARVGVEREGHPDAEFRDAIFPRTLLP